MILWLKPFKEKYLMVIKVIIHLFLTSILIMFIHLELTYKNLLENTGDLEV